MIKNFLQVVNRQFILSSPGKHLSSLFFSIITKIFIHLQSVACFWSAKQNGYAQLYMVDQKTVTHVYTFEWHHFVSTCNLLQCQSCFFFVIWVSYITVIIQTIYEDIVKCVTHQMLTNKKQCWKRHWTETKRLEIEQGQAGLKCVRRSFYSEPIFISANFKGVNHLPFFTDFTSNKTITNCTRVSMMTQHWTNIINWAWWNKWN